MPGRRQGAAAAAAGRKNRTPEFPRDVDSVTVEAGDRAVRLTNLGKVFWRDLGLTKGDLLSYYASVSPYLLPHLRSRAMVMKRYPNGIQGEFFFMKRAPSPRPPWVQLCPIEHGSGSVISFPVVQDLASLLWIVNLGCIDLNPWYARCDDVNRPDYLHFDLDPVEGADFAQVREAALLVHEALDRLEMPNVAKTTGSRGMHIYVPIVRGPTQKQVWTFAKALALRLAELHPEVLTAEYRVTKRPRGRVLVDYNQNAWGRTLASVYSVRPNPEASVSTPVKWKEVEAGFGARDFTVRNVLGRLSRLGDLWLPMARPEGRFPMEKFL
ncbi:MAG: non-homologous end-joining DNA ligase [bacterium]